MPPQNPRTMRGTLFRPTAPTAAFALLSLTFTIPAFATSFTINGSSTTAQTLGSGTGQTGTINAGSTLTISGSTVAVTLSGNNAALTNLGTISQTGTGRVLRDNTGVTGLVITNGSITNSAALMQAADADVIQMNVANGSVTLNNYGSMISLNTPTIGGNQAVDFSAITTGANTINNFSTGIMQASEADAVRPGVNGVVSNAGTIKSTSSTGSSSDGVDAQNNTGVSITNASSGLIEGARHGITGAALNNTVSFTTSVSNNTGSIIKGNNGSGINFDGFNANQTATIINGGAITGNGITGDGDGVDVDGLVNITNTGIIRSINAFSATVGVPAQSEGISVGGGTITNSGTIEGLVASGNNNAVGRGISLLGNDITTGPLTGTREAIYGNATVTNQNGGLIRGDSDSGIAVNGPASGFTVTINNNAGATIQGGGASNAAILTGADNDTITNSGTINGSSSGKAIEMGAGNNTLNITGGTASILGSVSGGIGGTNAMTVNPGAGNRFSYSGSISNFNAITVQSGKLVINGNISTSTLTTIKPGASIGGTGTIGGLTVEANGTLAPGNSPGIISAGDTTLQGGSILDIQLEGSTVGTGYDQLNVTGTVSLAGLLTVTTSFTPLNGSLFFLVANDGTDPVSGVFSNAALDGNTYTFSGQQFAISYAGNSSTNSFTGGNDLALMAVPEPSAASLLGGFGIITLLRRRR